MTNPARRKQYVEVMEKNKCLPAFKVHAFLTGW